MTSFDDFPMFPLGQPLLPGALLPLQVFESRYLALMKHCLEMDEPMFGVVMIERGREVGGGDERSSIGTLARIVDIASFDDGRLAVTTVGAERLRVIGWHDDAPFPRARIESWPDEFDGEIDDDDVMRRVADLRATLDLVERLGGPTSELPDLSGFDATMATHALGTLAPLGAADRHRLLAAPGPRARLRVFDDVLAEVTDALRFRLGT